MVHTEAWKSWQGRSINGKFPLREWLGGSDHSAVFLTDFGAPQTQKAAIKLIPCDESKPGDLELARWATAAKLLHPHLIRILATGRATIAGSAVLYVVMEYAEENLAQILPERPLTPTEVADLLPPLLDAVSYIHQNGLIHGAIKPSNILATGDQLKLSSDSVCATSDPAPQTIASPYAAPELASQTVSPAADVWSLGMTLVAVLTQHAPAYDAGAQSDPVVPSTLPEPFHGIARACLRRDAAQRCSISEIKARLNQSQSAIPAVPLSTAAPNRRDYSRPAWRIIVPVVAIVFVLVVFGFRMIAGNHEATVRQLPPMPAPTTSDTLAKPHQPAKPSSFAGKVAHEVMPEPPKSASNTITGRILVNVQVQVDTSGKVTDASFKTRGSSPYFANLALQAARGWEFSPPIVDGRAMPSSWNVRFQFRRSGIQASAARVGG